MPPSRNPNLAECISVKLRQINELLGAKQTPFETVDGVCTPCPGNVHLDGAYGGHSIRRMSSTGSGDSPLVTHGYYSRRAVLLQLEAYHKGMIDAREAMQRQQQVS